MPYRTSRKNGMSRRSTALAPYPGGQTRRQTEEHGDLNVYNRMYQFYNYHADKDILIDEMCRGLILSLLRISGGAVQEYDEPLGWTAPYWQDHCAHHYAIVFHMKDQRRHSSTFAKTLSSFSGKSQPDSDRKLPDQFDADHLVSHSAVPTWVQLYNADGSMKSMVELASDLASCIKVWIEAQTFGGAEDSETAVRGLDLVPSRLQLLKRCVVAGVSSYEVLIDDREFEASKVDVSAFSTITMQNVTPASGDSLMTSDPLSSDTINHVALKGKMYTFSGPVPKVWDRHRSELQHLFKPSFFEKGRYLLPNSKLHDETMEDFRTFPKGRFIWSNCIGEERITFQPGSMQKLKLQYRMRTSVRDFFHKFRNDDISSSKLGRCVCLALEPSIRRQHVGKPISAVLPKRLWRDGVVNTAVQYEPYEWKEVPEIGPTGLSTGRTIIAKRVRQVFTLDTSVIPTEQSPNPALAELWWVDANGDAFHTAGGVTSPPANSIPLKWDSITRDMVAAHPQLAHFVSKGDPIMFNVQINRLYLASSRLKNYARLGADKSGVKRKHEDKMYSNMGDVSFAYAQQVGDTYKDHNLQSAVGVGVAPLILEGDDRNTMVTVNIASEQEAFENALMAMDADATKDGLQLDVVGSALSALDGIIDTTGLKVLDQGVIDAVDGIPVGAAGPSAQQIADAIAATELTVKDIPDADTRLTERLEVIAGQSAAAATTAAATATAAGTISTSITANTALANEALAAAASANVTAIEAGASTVAASITSNTALANAAVANAAATTVAGNAANLALQFALPTDVNVVNADDFPSGGGSGGPSAQQIADAIAATTLNVNVGNEVDTNVQSIVLTAAEQVAQAMAAETLNVNVGNEVDVTDVAAEKIAQAIAEQTIDVALQTPNYIAGLIADAIESRQLSVTSSDKDLIGFIDGINTSAVESDSAFTVRTLNGDVHVLQKVTVFSGGAIDVSEWNPSIHKYRIVFRKPGQNIWRLSSNSVDIGQDINVTIPDGALSATVNIPETMNVNVMNTVGVTGTVDANVTGTVDANVTNTVDVSVPDNNRGVILYRSIEGSNGYINLDIKKDDGTLVFTSYPPSTYTADFQPGVQVVDIGPHWILLQVDRST
jgi:hypothetical protein